ncbi:hypothetical protein BATDEDRAFT_21258 [Batrachochytrium dendrobatidis JAM81]|uniref:Dol-P-Glc:Glc(2)Man(9)GlcNAc(2)-PP-Dol alpha-1,2-glucosyltransferase n=1 Tax=Batrachochytrium dendrobatidis (strain JAM81 / FGSC 10211) TaxID=684364 RepID=F4NRZ3_BATDJ|nr:uncharacterized protein BATDEDRAFT_21258 [Batrachochytrium dendrobatidis JAM81]EGF82982.1 hypothetical protein BATDEDRAFT_21258 [Batrachochytrium dendrobatidis JAM81]|eukprot:XP_006675238.1 hypothetical protein BATDEDRAFT_21258 [Batrachochytrium dendrobatidis JAM81]
MATVQQSAAAAVAAFSSLLGVMTALINQRVPDSYMDEIFHVPQAQQYCTGVFDQWDSKLTTPPGLYLVSLGFHKLWIAFLQTPISGCSVLQLRSVNAAFGIATLPVIFNLIPLIHPARNQSFTFNAIEAFVISLFPISFFFHLLYYTDSGSTFFVLFSYYLSLRDKLFFCALTGFISIWFRQTNVIWVAFIAATICIRHLQSIDSTTALDCPGYKLKSCGDKTNHTAGLHIPQLYYFCGFSAFFGFFAVNIPQAILNFPVWIVAPAIMFETVRRFTIEHPFLLADNRHFTFYIWKNIFRQYAEARYVLIPVYMFCAWAIVRQLAKTQSVLWIVAYIGSVMLTLIPSPLLEFRYFTIPFILLRLHIATYYRSESTSGKRTTKTGFPGWGWALALALECILFVGINVSVLYLFLEKPFEWPTPTDGSNSIGHFTKMRFMW